MRFTEKGVIFKGKVSRSVVVLVPVEAIRDAGITRNIPYFTLVGLSGSPCVLRVASTK